MWVVGKPFETLSPGFAVLFPLFRFVSIGIGAASTINLEFLQKGDSSTSKELAIVAITRIYVLTNPFQTLVREIATPSLPGFITACVQLIKQKSPEQPPSVPVEVIETICEAFATLIPLYPTTFRPFSSQIRNALRPCVAPTSYDDRYISKTLTTASRKVVVALHYVAAKSTGNDEWVKLQDDLLKELHLTADQVLRAVHESWQPAAGYDRSKADLDGEPRRIEAGLEHLPSWEGINAGAERLQGLFEYLGDCLSYGTKASVAVPIGALMDAICRICVIARLTPKTQTWEQAVETNPGVSRDEKEELWSAMVTLHIAALRLILRLVNVLNKDMIPFIPDALDHLTRTFRSGISTPELRSTGYEVLNSILCVAGCTMSKHTIEMLDTIMASCCRDLQEDIGLLKQTEKTAASAKDKKTGLLANADLFLQSKTDIQEVVLSLESTHRNAAASLLTALLSQIPQVNLKPTLRGLLDKTAILTHNKDAMYASVLNPYKDQRGRLYASILPYLSRQYPEDPNLEILRSNLRTSGAGANDMSAALNLLDEADGVEDKDEVMGEDADQEEKENGTSHTQSVDLSAPRLNFEAAIGENPFAATADESVKSNAFADVTNDNASKRKNEEVARYPAAKRQDREAKPQPTNATVEPANAAEESESDDESVHLNMELDDDEDE